MKFSGVTILQGVEFSIFAIDIEWALKQCSATALPAIEWSFLLHALQQKLSMLLNGPNNFRNCPFH